jgi:hypothetical protein
MYARSVTLGLLFGVAFAPPIPSVGSYALQSTGVVQLRATGYEAQYGLVSTDGLPILSVSLGAADAPGAVHLSIAADRLPSPGRYPIGSNSFHASFMAGTAEHPLGWFHGESGWVTISAAGAGHIVGSFEVQARGFTTQNQADENQVVTVRGSFDAEGDSSIATIASAR